MPVTTSAYVDESHRRTYLLCAVVVGESDRAQIRRLLRALCRPGQRRLHMYHESDRRRRHILTSVTRLPITAHVYETAVGNRTERSVRDDCLRLLIPGMAAASVAGITIESCGQDRDDNRAIRDALTKLDSPCDLLYSHAEPATEPLLWLPDIIGWAYGRGADWRRRVTPLIAGSTGPERAKPGRPAVR